MTEEKLSEEIFGPLGESGEGEEIQGPTLGVKDIISGETTVIKKASEVVNLTKEQVLEADMKKLAGIDEEIAECESENEDIWAEIIAFQVQKGYDKTLANLSEAKADLQNQYNELKEDIGKRGLEISRLTKYTNKLPIPGVQIKDFSKEELAVDREKAVAWAVKKELLNLLDIQDETYRKQLEVGTFKDQPGKMEDVEDYRVYISLKPYQKKE